VLLADAICRTTHSKSEWRHPKRLGVVTAVDTSEIEKFLLGQFQARNKIYVETLAQFGRREFIISGGNRSVRREDALRSNCFLRFIEGRGRIRRQIFAGKLEREKCRMTFVKMKDRWGQSELSQKSNAADAENLFLDDSRLGAPAIQMAGDETIDFDVHGKIRIKKIKRDASDLREPRLGMNLAAADVDNNRDAIARIIEYGFES
jgi:hypothetical protein